MKRRLLAVKDMVQITGITPRTLHYYDRIDLFKPTQLAENGYRYYDYSSLEKLQTILFLKEIGFSLKEIADIVKLAKHEQKQVLEKHSQTLQLQQQKLAMMITSLQEYIAGTDIYNLQIFKESSVLPLQQQYAQEASYLYSETESYQQFTSNINKLTAEQRATYFAEFEQSMESIFRKIANAMNQAPDSEEVQQLIVEWKSYLKQFMVCDAELLVCIAKTYKYDTRFKNYINQYSEEDVVEFIYTVVMHYVEREV
ncbi:MerR family transcriptional regulator [Paenibacillus yanchengensis]|uniref:MerR family transcriptional regulator n=1 Tax=Paenibacillus yanchengensis TaxID=2035833 RepID=A0ABW4YF88_9BACL